MAQELITDFMTALDDQRDNMQEGAYLALANAVMRLRGALLVEGPAQPCDDTDTAGEDDLEAVSAGAANMTSYCEVCDGTFHRNRVIWYSSPHSYRPRGQNLYSACLRCIATHDIV